MDHTVRAHLVEMIIQGVKMALWELAILGDPRPHGIGGKPPHRVRTGKTGPVYLICAFNMLMGLAMWLLTIYIAVTYWRFNTRRRWDALPTFHGWLEMHRERKQERKRQQAIAAREKREAETREQH